MRLLQNASGRIRLELVDDLETIVDSSGPVTVDLFDGAGVQLAAGLATSHDGTGVYSAALTPAQTGALDLYVAVWHVTVGAAQTRVTPFEVVGGRMFTVTEARQFERGALADTTKFPTVDILAARELTETVFERLSDDGAFFPRGARVRLDGSGTSILFLPHDRIRRLVAATVDSLPLTVDELAGLDVQEDGWLVKPSGLRWKAGDDNVSLYYEHGDSQPEPRIRRAALIFAKHHLIGGPIDDRATSFTNELGTQQLAVPGGRFGSIGIPEVDAALAEYTQRTPVAR